MIIFPPIVFSLWGCQSNIEKSPLPEKPNIIVMYSDDHTAQAIGAYQGALNYGLQLDHTPTPNIDRLAEGGMRFDNAFVTNSICRPSRAVMLTGLHSHLNGVLTNSEDLPVDMETFPGLMQAEGYQTAMIGKWHLGSDPQGFDYYEVLASGGGQGSYYNPKMLSSNGETEYEGYTTEIITDIALRWLKRERNPGEPFMMIYNHKAPHREWLPGPDHLDDYHHRDLPEPDNLLFDYSGLTTAAREQDMEIETSLRWGEDLKLPLNPETGEPNPDWEYIVTTRNRLTDDQLKRIEQAYSEENEYLYQNYDQMSREGRIRWRYQRYLKDYLRTVRGVDDEVGRMMAWLERENLLDNTIIIYAGDQGFFLGEKGWFDKRWIYEESMRMPLIVHWPDGIEPGTVNDNLVQNLDLAPTVLDLAGLKVPDQMQGLSLVPLLRSEQPGEWREGVYYQYYEGPPRVHRVARHYGVRTDRYTLAHFPDNNEWELFDLESDPNQMESVYGQPEYEDIQKDLKNMIDEFQEQYKDDSWDERSQASN